MKSLHEFLSEQQNPAMQQMSANIAGQTASAVLQQVQKDPVMKANWEKIIEDFPKLFAFLSELNTLSRGNWKVTPAQFTQTLMKHLTKAAGAKGIAQTAPLQPK